MSITSERSAAFIKERGVDILPVDIEPAPNFGTNIRTDYIYGMGKVDDKFIILLNPDSVLSINELAMLETISGEKEVEQLAPPQT